MLSGTDTTTDANKSGTKKMKAQGLRVKLALNERGKVGGGIQYIPIEHAAVEGRDLYFVECL